jgi:putative endonuclease
MAAAHLTAQGWNILARNWRFHHKEIDIIAERSGVVAFVEVKARKAAAWGHPLEAITRAKRRDLDMAARAWIAGHPEQAECYRFDAAVMVRDGNRSILQHFEDAWRI